MRARIYKLSLLLLIFVFLFSLISCKTDAQKIAELEEKIATLEKEEPAVVEEQASEATEESDQEESATETVIVEPEKELSPAIISTLYIQGYTTNIYVIGDYAYAGGQGLNIIDVTDKNNPKIIKTINEWVYNFCIEGDYAYIPYSIWDDKRETIIESGFKIIDITDKEKPSEVGLFKMNGDIDDIAVSGNYVFISYSITEKQDEGYFMVTGGGLEVIDITDKENLFSVGNFDSGNSGGGPFSILEEYCYFFSGNDLKILDLKDIENVTKIGSYLSSGWASSLFAEGDYVYIPSMNTLQIIDISDKEKLIMTGGAFANGDIQGIFVKDDYAYITYVIRDNEEENWQVKESGLQIIDITNKNSPSVVAKIDIPGEALGIYVDGDHAYVGAGQAGMHIVKLFN